MERMKHVEEKKESESANKSDKVKKLPQEAQTQKAQKPERHDSRFWYTRIFKRGGNRPKGKAEPLEPTTSTLMKTQSLVDAPAKPLHVNVRSSEAANASTAANEKHAMKQKAAEKVALKIIELLLHEGMSENKKAKAKKELTRRVEKVKDVLSKSTLKDERELKAFLRVVGATLEADGTMVRVERPVTVVGDIHGQLLDLLYIFKEYGLPPHRRYLFIGDYVDRGPHGTECLLLLYSIKLHFPESIYLLRGNHENKALNSVYGFKNEFISKFSELLYKKVLRTFDRMPVMGLIGGEVFCVHGGIGANFLDSESLQEAKSTTSAENPSMTSLTSSAAQIVDETASRTDRSERNALLEKLSSRRLPLKGLNHDDPFWDFFWADPANGLQEELTVENRERNTSVLFGRRALESFLRAANLRMVVRGHQLCSYGYEFIWERQLLTLFSAPNYCGTNNVGAIAEFDVNDFYPTIYFVLQKGQVKPKCGPDGGGRKRGSTQWEERNLQDDDEVDVPDETAGVSTAAGQQNHNERLDSNMELSSYAGVSDVQQRLSLMSLESSNRPYAQQKGQLQPNQFALQQRPILQTRAASPGNALTFYQRPNVLPQYYNPLPAMVPRGTRGPVFAGAPMPRMPNAHSIGQPPPEALMSIAMTTGGPWQQQNVPGVVRVWVPPPGTPTNVWQNVALRLQTGPPSAQPPLRSQQQHFPALSAPGVAMRFAAAPSAAQFQQRSRAAPERQ